MQKSDDVVRKIRLTPDAGLVKSLGANHSLNSAIADIIDNSVDAEASRVVIRLLTSNGRLVRVEIVDNGRGMENGQIDHSMTIGHQREYREGDLGHFGVGLKAASFSHADALTVWSRASGSTAVGRRIRRTDFSRDFTCEVLSRRAAAEASRQRRKVLNAVTGTTVVWESLRGMYRGRSLAEAQAWLFTAEVKLRAHLGVVFHRRLAKGLLNLEVIVEDIERADGALGIPVQSVDPFGYQQSGHPDYPKKVVITAEGHKVSIVCHVWPGRTDITGFRIGGSKGEEHQGFFVYRNERLLQMGGWSGSATASTSRQLARVVLDDAEAIGRFVTMNSEKQGLRFEPVFLDALGHAHAEDGTTFDDFLESAETVYAESRRRRRARKPAIRPQKGFPPEVRKRIGVELPMLEGEVMRVSWARLPASEFLDVDHKNKTVLLNARYRAFFAPQGGSLNDAPLLKALVYLLTHRVMEGHHLGSKEKDDIALWKSVLGDAARTEFLRREQKGKQ